MDKFREIEVRVTELKALVEDFERVAEDSEPDPYAEGDRRYDEQRDNEQWYGNWIQSINWPRATVEGWNWRWKAQQDRTLGHGSHHHHQRPERPIIQ